MGAGFRSVVREKPTSQTRGVGEPVFVVCSAFESKQPQIFRLRSAPLKMTILTFVQCMRMEALSVTSVADSRKRRSLHLGRDDKSFCASYAYEWYCLRG